MTVFAPATYLRLKFWWRWRSVSSRSCSKDDWFKSTFIVSCAIVSGRSFLAFVPWELSRDDPIVDISLIGRRQFGTSFFIMMAVGAILFGATQLMPQLLQETFDYTATLAGLALMPGGLASMVRMIAAGQVSRLVQPRYMMAGALLGISLALYRFGAGRGLRMVRLGARLPDGRDSVPVPDDHELCLRRPALGKIGTGVGADQRRSQPRREHGHIRCANLAGATGAVPSVAS